MTNHQDTRIGWRWSSSPSPSELPDLLEREWLETNGLGGFASGTVAGPNTRRYHGILVAAVDPPLGRFSLVASLQETLVRDSNRTELGTNLFRGGQIHPRGFFHLQSFDLAPAPVWRFRTPQGTLEKTVSMIQGRNLTVVRYELLEGSEADFEVRLLLSGRDYHAIMRANEAVKLDVRQLPGVLYIPLYEGVPSVWVGHQAHTFTPERIWYFEFDYPRERDRGLEDREDLISAGVLHYRLRPGLGVWLAVGTDAVCAEDAAELFSREIASRATWPLADSPDALTRQLARGTAPFMARRSAGLSTVIAGYPWFGDWGRDTFISLPGIALVTGRFQVARRVILAFAEQIHEGLVPNRFPDCGGPACYHSVDATLWFLAAVHQYVTYSGDLALLRGGLMDSLDSIIDWHERGTRFNIHEDEDGLLVGGDEGVQLTWMDAKVEGVVVTPRRGKPVEVSALWYNGLHAMADLSRRLGRTRQAERYEAKAALTRSAFNAKFWNPAAQCLYDVLEEHGADARIRPNQILALSLPFPVLCRARRGAILETVRSRLLTPLGLRTLDPADPSYVGRFQGGPSQRDRAYHQGTVWPWLLGPFITATMRSSSNPSLTRMEMRRLLDGVEAHLSRAGLGSVCELADGDPPHRPGGCLFQAWSVAEPLRALCEDIQGQNPAGEGAAS